MKFLSQTQSPLWPSLAWSSVMLLGIIAPAAAMLALAQTSPNAPSFPIAGPLLALGLMGTGMIAAAVVGRFWIGVCLALAVGAGLVSLARAVGLPSLPDTLATGLAFLVASVSFAARGALFARSASARGWLIAVFVVAGEAAILITAMAQPGLLPDWLLVLLPAQWASVAIQSSFGGTAIRAADAALVALGGTAAATLLVAALWPRRWPYLIMFTTWLGLSALVWHQSPAASHTDLPMVAVPADQSMENGSGGGTRIS